MLQCWYFIAQFFHIKSGPKMIVLKQGEKCLFNISENNKHIN